MPTKRRPINRPARLGDLDPAIVDYLVTGEWRKALDSLKAREQPLLIMWLDDVLAGLWQSHAPALEAEAARRGIKAWWPTREARCPRVWGKKETTR